MAFHDEQDGDRRAKAQAAEEKDHLQQQDGKKRQRKRGSAPEVGHALRNVYQRTIDEDIPPEMLDLLGKLG